MESDVRKLLVNKIAKNIYEALRNRRTNDDVVVGGDGSDNLMASILESVHGTLGGDEGNSSNHRLEDGSRKSECYVPIPLTVEELNSNREFRSGPKYQVPTPNCTKYQVPSPKYQVPTSNCSGYQVPSPKYEEPSSKYQYPSPNCTKHKAPSPKNQEPSPKYQVPSPRRPKSSKKNGVRWATMPEESSVVDEDCSREFDELYYNSVVTGHKKTDRGAENSKPRKRSVRFGG